MNSRYEGFRRAFKQAARPLPRVSHGSEADIRSAAHSSSAVLANDSVGCGSGASGPKAAPTIIWRFGVRVSPSTQPDVIFPSAIVKTAIPSYRTFVPVPPFRTARLDVSRINHLSDDLVALGDQVLYRVSLGRPCGFSEGIPGARRVLSLFPSSRGLRYRKR